MMKAILITAFAALAACSEKPQEAADNSAAPVEEAVPAQAAGASTAPGTYDVTMSDGTTGVTVINADGTYIDTAADGKVVKGQFANKDGKDCFDPEGDEPEMCWSVSSPNADGSFSATDPDGTVVIVKPRTS